jgi:hypothetical protein
MKKKELKKIKKEYPILEYSQLRNLITFHLKELTEYANGYLQNDELEFDFGGARFHLNELQKVFKKESKKNIVQKLSI